MSAFDIYREFEVCFPNSPLSPQTIDFDELELEMERSGMDCQSTYMMNTMSDLFPEEPKSKSADVFESNGSAFGTGCESETIETIIQSQSYDQTLSEEFVQMSDKELKTSEEVIETIEEVVETPEVVVTTTEVKVKPRPRGRPRLLNKEERLRRKKEYERIASRKYRQKCNEELEALERQEREGNQKNSRLRAHLNGLNPLIESIESLVDKHYNCLNRRDKQKVSRSLKTIAKWSE